MPGDAWNDTSIAAMAGKSQAQWLSEMKAKASAGHVSVLEEMFRDLPPDMPFPLALLTVLARQLIQAPEKIWDSVVDLTKDIPIIGDVVQFLDQVHDIIIQLISGLLTWVQANILDPITGAVGSGIKLFVDWAVKAATGVTNLVKDVLGFAGAAIGDLVSFLRYGLWGQIDPRRITVVPASAVKGVVPNPLINNNFDSPASLSAELNWSWDGTEGKSTLGAAKAIAHGNLTELVSNPVNVVEGEGVNFSVYAKWAGISYSGAGPIAMGVDLYRANILVGSEDLAYINNPIINGDWTVEPNLSYIGYIVPPEVDQISIRLKLDSTALSGTVWWDEASIEKTDFINDDIVPGVGQTIDSIVNGLEHISGEEFDRADAYASLFGTKTSQTSMATRMAYLESLLNTTGIAVVEDFEYLNDTGTISDEWLVRYWGSGAGHAKVDGDELVWVRQGFGARNFTAKWIGDNSSTTTDRQRVTAVLGSAPEYYTAFLLNPWFGGNILRARVGDDDNSEIRAYFYGSGRIVLGCIVDGVWTQFVETTGARPTASSTISLVVGTDLDDNHIVAEINGSAKLSWVDSLGISRSGATYRGHGTGMTVQGQLLLFKGAVQAAGGNLHSYAAADQS